MKAEDLKTKSKDELVKLLMDNRKAQFNLRFQKSNGALENTSEMRKTRRTIARIKTFLSQQGGEDAPKTATKKPAAKKKTTSKAKAA
ncbi:MAG: 50S ribosomal protein L29 [Alphaproteobacteria bacterium]|nr:50S ribosomal protein L29 [Alphaproteobacteria bacterium]